MEVRRPAARLARRCSPHQLERTDGRHRGHRGRRGEDGRTTCVFLHWARGGGGGGDRVGFADSRATGVTDGERAGEAGAEVAVDDDGSGTREGERERVQRTADSVARRTRRESRDDETGTGRGDRTERVEVQPARVLQTDGKAVVVTPLLQLDRFGTTTTKVAFFLES